MIATIGIILLFVVTGLGVVFLAFGGGASGAREQLHSQTRIGRRVAFVAIALVTVVFGIGVPALLLDYNADSQAKSSVGGVDLNESQIEGRELFAQQCATCHTLKGANAVGKVGPDLDAMRPPAELTVNAIEEGRARGQGQMPADLVDSVDAKKVAGFVAAVAGRQPFSVSAIRMREQLASAVGRASMDVPPATDTPGAVIRDRHALITVRKLGERAATPDQRPRAARHRVRLKAC